MIHDIHFELIPLREWAPCSRTLEISNRILLLRGRPWGARSSGGSFIAGRKNAFTRIELEAQKSVACACLLCEFLVRAIVLTRSQQESGAHRENSRKERGNRI